MGPPKTVYYVMGENTGMLPYGQRGGGLFTRLAHAMGRRQIISDRSGYRATSRLFEGTVEWKEIIDA